MPRRRNENGLKRQQRIETEQRQQPAVDNAETDNRKVEQTHPAAVPPGITQPFENLAPPIITPRPEE